MHRSRLGGFIIDCRSKDLRGSADFWASALGTPVKESAYASSSSYVELQRRPDELYIEVQQVDQDRKSVV